MFYCFFRERRGREVGSGLARGRPCGPMAAALIVIDRCPVPSQGTGARRSDLTPLGPVPTPAGPPVPEGEASRRRKGNPVSQKNLPSEPEKVRTPAFMN